jgi:glutamine cyclotransferase
VPDIHFTIAETFPHDTLSFTEGFLFHDGVLFESTGSPDNIPYTRSVFGPVDLSTGKIDKKAELDRSTYFGEGIVFVDGKILQLTYKNQLGFIYDAKTYKRIGQFNYQNKEGWGLTTDGKNIIMSDGTSTLTYLDPMTLKVVKTLNVSENGYAADYLNELEWIKGFIYANVWTTNKIVKIDPATGKVIGKLDCISLLHEARIKYSNATELNGIAYDPASDKIYVTGKLWPSIYRIEFPH